MKLKNFVIMSGFTVGTIFLAIWLSDLGPDVEFDPAAPFFPELRDGLERIRVVEINDGSQTLTLRYQQESWRLDQRHGFPANSGSVRDLVLAVAALTPVQPRSNNPEHHATLGVAEPGQDGGGIRISGLDEQGQELFSFLAGKRPPQNGTQQYIRRSGEPLAWLVNGSINPPRNPEAWLDKTIIDIAADQIQEIRYLDNDGLRLTRQQRQTDLQLQGMDLPTGVPPDYFNSQSSLLAALPLVDFFPVTQANLSLLPLTHTSITTFDGLIINCRYAEDRGRALLALSFSFQDPRQGENETLAAQAVTDPQQVFAQARRLNLRHQDWVYVLSNNRAVAFHSPVARRLARQTPAADAAP